MKFNFWGIVLMIIAVIAGQFIGEMLIPFLGSAGGGILGSFIIGAIAYVIYSLLVGSKFRLMRLVLFSVLIYVSNMVAGYIATVLGIGVGYMSLAITGVIMSFIWGWVGGKKPKAKKLKL